jgi:hypothetical protein
MRLIAGKATGAQGNRVNKVLCDKADQEVVIPGGELPAKSEGVLAEALLIWLWAMCLIGVKFTGALASIVPRCLRLAATTFAA